MSMDPCEEFRVHAAKNLVGLRFFCKNSSSFDEPRSLSVIETSRQKTLDRTTLKNALKYHLVHSEITFRAVITSFLTPLIILSVI